MTTYDFLFDRESFYNELEHYLQSKSEVRDLIVVLGANIPLAKFSVYGVNVDLVFVDFETPKLESGTEYLENPNNVVAYSYKSADCMRSYKVMLELQRIIAALEPNNSDRPMQVFSRTCRLIKCFA